MSAMTHLPLVIIIITTFFAILFLSANHGFYDEFISISPLSPLLFNIYVRELGKVISNCVHGVKYAVLGKDGVMEWNSQAGLLYADDVCVMANSEEDMKVIIEKINECGAEYGLKVKDLMRSK